MVCEGGGGGLLLHHHVGGGGGAHSDGARVVVGEGKAGLAPETGVPLHLQHGTLLRRGVADIRYCR